MQPVLFDGESESNTILSITCMNYLNLIQWKTCSIQMKLDLQHFKHLTLICKCRQFTATIASTTTVAASTAAVAVAGADALN